MKYRGKISFKMDKNHPDIKYIKNYIEDRVYTFEDEYTFNEGYTEEIIIPYIKEDLSLVAGGGYNADHIYDVTFEIKRI